jgi:hypothetical protein
VLSDDSCVYAEVGVHMKSQNKKQLNSFFSSELSIELYSSNNWWIVECFGRKPD